MIRLYLNYSSNQIVIFCHSWILNSRRCGWYIGCFDRYPTAIHILIHNCDKYFSRRNCGRRGHRRFVPNELTCHGRMHSIDDGPSGLCGRHKCDRPVTGSLLWRRFHNRWNVATLYVIFVYYSVLPHLSKIHCLFSPVCAVLAFFIPNIRKTSTSDDWKVIFSAMTYMKR